MSVYLNGRSVAFYMEVMTLLQLMSGVLSSTSSAQFDLFRKSSARILFLPLCIPSHFYQVQPVIRELAARGHNVQVVLTDEGVVRFGPSLSDLPSVQVVGYNTSNNNEFSIRQALRAEKRAVGFDSMRKTWGAPMHSHPLLQNTDLHNKIKAFKPDFAFTDLVLVGGQALADKLAIPKGIMFVPGLLEPIAGHSFGSGGTLLSTVPAWMTLLPRNMNFLQRVQNFIGGMMSYFVWCHIIEPEMDKTFWHDIPPHSYLKSNRQAALVLFHVDWAHTRAGPMGPHMLAVGAITAAPAKALPADLENFVQSGAEHGVVYASLGTTAIPEAEELREIAQGLSALAPVQVIWKLSDTDVVALGENSSLAVGSNVKIVKWVNQNDVLGHPNVKAFFTQGGTNSFNEASYQGVPMVAMPLFAEQPDNIARAMDRGYALSVSVKKLDRLAADLEAALRRVLTEPSFAANAARVSYIMRAHRQTPVQVAADAIEHAAWTKGGQHMQPLQDDLSWFQTQSLDVLGFLACIALACVCVASLALLYLTRKGLQFAQTQRSTLHAKAA